MRDALSRGVGYARGGEADHERSEAWTADGCERVASPYGDDGQEQVGDRRERRRPRSRAHHRRVRLGEELGGTRDRGPAREAQRCVRPPEPRLLGVFRHERRRRTDGAQREDVTVSNNRPIQEVAAEILEWLGWGDFALA